ncbi:MAG: diaminopimelate decarboxylase [Chitinispirillaceae bacterium]|nr:diaminopimelate decarboxylase [Chitinispirillaceae bacterium]
MSEVKKLPCSTQKLIEICNTFPTPFHIYDEEAILNNLNKLYRVFSWNEGFKEYFAVKATPNPFILKLLKNNGAGADCSSLTELILAERCGIKGEEIMFTSNDTPAEEFVKARELNAIINLDDITHIPFLEKHAGLPELISLRYNPGPRKTGNSIIGHPEEAKYGFTYEQLFEGYKTLKEKGVKRFGLHTMVASNELNPNYFIDTAIMLYEIAVELKKQLNIKLEFVNIGGGIGIPYKPDQKPMDLKIVSDGIKKSYENLIVPAELHPIKLFMECGRMITGPYGWLVTRVLHIKKTYKNYVGTDACMANLMRPAIYGAYHHITVLGKEDKPLDHIYDVTGSLCENNDKFAINRSLPEVEVGDILIIHDTGAHGHAMGFNYNGKLRSAELLLRKDGSVVEIRRREIPEDLFATLDFQKLKDFN